MIYRLYILPGGAPIRDGKRSRTDAPFTLQVAKSLVKDGRIFVEVFTKKWIPYLEKHFKQHHKPIVKLLKSLQKGTRGMQVICGHGKAEKELGIAASVPAIKKSLESLMYSVKLMLTNAGFEKSFGQGILSHKDYEGHVISSQREDESGSEDEGEGSGVESGDDSGGLSPALD
jgi:Fanconi anemia group D2 protein